MTKLYLLDGIFISCFQIQGLRVLLLIKYVPLLKFEASGFHCFPMILSSKVSMDFRETNIHIDVQGSQEVVFICFLFRV